MRLRYIAITTVVLSAATAGTFAQPPKTVGYLTPPKAIVDILDAEPLPIVTTGPSTTIAIVRRRGMPAIEELAQPVLRIAGLRINPRNNGPHRMPSGIALSVKDAASGQERAIDVPAGARLDAVTFSPNGRLLSFTNTRDTRIDLHIADVATGRTRVVEAAVNGVGSPCAWLDDSSGLLCTFVPAGRAAAPARPKAPSGPNVQENAGKAGPVRTYQDLLTSAYDEDLFEYYTTAQLGIVDAASGRMTPVGQPALVDEAHASPDGQFILVRRTKRPFSRLLPSGGFPASVEVWSRRGEMVRSIADVPMSDTVPINGVITGPRACDWHPLQPATLVWVEALDKGDIKNKVPHRDRVMTLRAPFSGDAAEVAKTEFRYTSARWTDSGTILLSESDRATRTTRTWVLDSAWANPRKLWDRKQQDSYGNPGTPVSRPGKSTIVQSGDAIFLIGQGATPEGDRPFLDRLDLKTLKSERLFRSDSASLETVVALMDDGAARVLTKRESRRDVPNYHVRDLRAGSTTAVTAFKDPHPQITGAERSLVTYKRKDGVQLSGTMYLPPGHKAGERLPMLVWAYPREFVDADAAGQVTGSANRFTTVTGASHLLLLTQGYAIFDGPTMPIVGPGETANDSYVDQLVASAAAAIDKAVDMGVAERHRVGVGGHSYGAFMTANLLAHSDLFAAGVARSGAYNRTLTPFGFQAETRTFWEVPQVYASMSPFYFANKINEPVLLVHGEADDNSGTFPIQSERLYMALKGHGATVRYVTLPHEAHGYAARESVLHTVAETVNWLDKYVKNAAPRSTTSTAGR